MVGLGVPGLHGAVSLKRSLLTCKRDNNVNTYLTVFQLSKIEKDQHMEQWIDDDWEWVKDQQNIREQKCHCCSL